MKILFFLEKVQDDLDLDPFEFLLIRKVLIENRQNIIPIASKDMPFVDKKTKLLEERREPDKVLTEILSKEQLKVFENLENSLHKNRGSRLKGRGYRRPSR